MGLVSVEQISKSYGERAILKDISITVDEGDKIGIIGVNGTGKSTLLQIMSGQEDPDKGAVVLSKDVKLSFLEQIPVYSDSLTIEEQVQQLLRKESLNMEYDVYKILNQLGLADLSLPVNTLSGGEKKKIALAVALLVPCDVLLLDEPTNHLDMQSVVWLEHYLRQYKGALVMITHDRYFLDHVTNTIVEIRGGSLYTYKSNFAGYMEIKAQEEESLLATERKNKSLYRKELEWMQQGAKARGTKSKERIARFDALETRDALADGQKLELSSVSSRLGKQIIELKDVSKGFDGRQLIDHFEYNILRNDRIGIVGDNGAGKTTLFKMITGELEPDAGEIVRGSTVKIGYYCQEHDDVKDKQQMRVIDYIKEAAEIITTPDGKITASQMLERFLFSADQQYTQIGKLSGGEQKRLFLLKLLMEAPNVLLLDEPTNDLDITTLQILEDYLESFPGAVLTISHDRYFLDKVVDFIFALEDEGRIGQYAGSYSDYLEKKPAKKEAAVESKEKKERKATNRTIKFSFKEQYDYDHIDGEIAELEEKLVACHKGIEEQSANYEKLEELLGKKVELEKELEEKMTYWAYLYDLAEQIETSKNGETL